MLKYKGNQEIAYKGSLNRIVKGYTADISDQTITNTPLNEYLEEGPNHWSHKQVWVKDSVKGQVCHINAEQVLVVAEKINWDNVNTLYGSNK